MIDIMYLMAVVVVLQIGTYVSLIVTEVVRGMMTVVMGEMIPIVRRAPVCICRTAKAVEQRRTSVEHRLDDIVNTIDIRCTDDLYVRCRISHLDNNCGYVLIDIGCQHGLEKQHMVTPFKSLKHTQIVDKSVAVEVEVGNDISIGVQYCLKLLDGCSLGKSSCHSLQVEIQTYILRHGRDLYSSCTRSVRARVRDGCADRCWVGNRLGLRHYNGCCGSRSDNNWFGYNGNNTCHTAACQQQRQS